MVKIAIVGPEESKWKLLTRLTLLQVKNRVMAEIYAIFRKYAVKTIRDYSEYYGEETYDFSNIILISGRCPKGGVDIWAEQLADELSIKKEIFAPEVNQWNDKVLSDLHGGEFVAYGYKSRNTKIAKTCDVLYCIVPKTFDATKFGTIPYGMRNKTTFCNYCDTFEHPTNGGCWTMKFTKKLGKETHLVVIE